MNKQQLIDHVAERTGLSRSAATASVDALFSTITETLNAGGDVRVTGFGNFVVQQRAATRGRNPMTGAPVDVPAKRVPKFSAGKGLKDAVNMSVGVGSTPPAPSVSSVGKDSTDP